MQKKNLIIIFLLVLAAGLFIYPRFTGGEEAIGISEVSAEPSKYLGELALAGKVGTVYPDEGYFVMVDGGGCCQIPAIVPFTAQQQTQLKDLGVDAPLYTGTLPAVGQLVETTGTLSREGANYMYDVETVIVNGEVIISKAK
ncbi:MAG: hypothetical protein SCK29_09995 [Bacillota bacterium]|nr:hypothetical protein [Bacillota bacterium]MDW7684432.1 hypothetical protein [Bacillota bacterium]